VDVTALGDALPVGGLRGLSVPLDDGHRVEEVREYARGEETRDAAPENEGVATQSV
jgi:hypothetical protein